MKVIDIDINLLKEYENNPRNNDGAVDAVAESIKQFGFKVPIVIDRDNVIVAGHTRLKAARKIRLEKVPCIVADDLTPEQIKAYRLADNKTAELAEWDFSALEIELAELESDFDMSDFGFENATFEEIDEADLDKENEKSGNVQITITFQSIIQYNRVEEQIKNIVNENCGEMVVRMI